MNFDLVIAIKETSDNKFFLDDGETCFAFDDLDEMKGYIIKILDDNFAEENQCSDTDLST